MGSDIVLAQQKSDGTTAQAADLSHPAYTLIRNIAGDKMHPEFWENKIRAGEKRAGHRYPCHQKTAPVIRQLMLYKIMTYLNSAYVQSQLANQLANDLGGKTVLELNQYFTNKSEYDDPMPSYPPEKQERIRQGLNKAGTMVGNRLRELERQVMRETDKEMPRIIRAFAMPNGACKAQ